MKKTLCILLSLAMLLSPAPLFAVSAGAETHTYQNGDIIEFGSYPQGLLNMNDIPSSDRVLFTFAGWQDEPDEWTAYTNKYAYNEEKDEVYKGGRNCDRLKLPIFPLSAFRFMRKKLSVPPDMVIRGVYFC